METLNGLTYKWFGADLMTIAQVLIIGALALLFAVSFVVGAVALLTDPGAADAASWGFAD